AVRQYVANLPADLGGPIDANFTSLSLSGRIGSMGREAADFSGNIRLQDLSIVSSSSAEHSFALDKLTIAGNVESPLSRWTPAALTVHDGILKFIGLTYGTNAVNDFDSTWQIDRHVLSTDHF